MEKTIIISLFLLLFSPYSVKAKQQKENIRNGHEYVDLGLPSGTLWATCNVGADKPEAFGDYFQWGDTKAYILDSLTFILNDGPHTYYLERDQRKLLEELPPSKRFGRLHDFTSAYKFTVTDHGSGIPKEALDRLTEPFYMVDKSRARAQGGAGLGLALCQKIAEVHGGKLVFESVPGKGTSVNLEIGGALS